jgi:hypothetical protein
MLFPMPSRNQKGSNRKTPELRLRAVKDNGRALEYVPDKLKTQELCLTAARNDARALQFVPEAFKKEFCAAGKRNKYSTTENSYAYSL